MKKKKMKNVVIKAQKINNEDQTKNKKVGIQYQNRYANGLENQAIKFKWYDSKITNQISLKSPTK